MTTKKPEEDILRDYFKKQLGKGDILSTEELLAYAKKRKLTLNKKFVKGLRSDVLSSALYLKNNAIKKFQTITHPKLGLLAIDFAYYKKDWYRFNNGYVGFLMIVSATPDKRWAIPMKNRETKSFEVALEEICTENIFPAVNVILSDRETTIFSSNFQNRMFDKYKVKFQFLHRYNKSWIAENAIRHTKKTLSIALRSNSTKRWVDLLQTCINNHNRRQINGTSFSPNQIDDSNFETYVNELKKKKDYTLYLNTNSIDSRSFVNIDWLNQIFKFQVNDKVLVARKAFGRKAFDKSSVEGTYNPEPYTIIRAKLRGTRTNSYVPGDYYCWNHQQLCIIELTFFLTYFQCIRLPTQTKRNWKVMFINNIY